MDENSNSRMVQGKADFFLKDYQIFRNDLTEYLEELKTDSENYKIKTMNFDDCWQSVVDLTKGEVDAQKLDTMLHFLASLVEYSRDAADAAFKKHQQQPGSQYAEAQKVFKHMKDDLQNIMGDLGLLRFRNAVTEGVKSDGRSQ